MQKARQWAYGAAAYERLIITENGRSHQEERTCEDYLETTDERHENPTHQQGCMMCGDSKLYVLSDLF